MASDNASVAGALAEIANLLELQAANQHRIQAYRTAAQTLRAMSPDFVEKAARGEATHVRGLGKAMLDKIGDLARKGTCPRLRELRRAVPVASRRLLDVPGLGPVRIRRLVQALPLRSMRDLESACRSHKIRRVAGFGARTEANILEAIASGRTATHRFDRDELSGPIARLTRHLRRLADVKVTVAGSYRRGRQSIGDVDILVATKSPARVVQWFTQYAGLRRVGSRGAVRATGYLDGNLQVDLRAVPPSVYGAALLYFTGSKAHNIELRRIARRKELKLNEYGLFQNDRLIAGATEESVYRALGLRWVPPAEREGLDSIQPLEAS